MKIAVFAEGESELGGRSDDPRDDGAAIAFVRSLLGARLEHELQIVPMKLSGRDLRRPDVRRAHGESETAQLAYDETVRRGCDALVFFRDADNDASGRRTKNLAGFSAAASRRARPLPAVLGLQINTLEAWLLADAGAFERAFGKPRPQLPRRCEELWGDRRDPASNHPKQVFRRFLSSLQIPRGRTTTTALAMNADLEVVARECPEGFGRFKQDFELAFRPFDCVVAADQANGIGRDNDLPWPKLKADLKHFRDLTTAAKPGFRNAVIMGRKTWDSVPPKYRPLAGRLNVVITRSQLDLGEDAVVASSLDDALNRASLRADVDQIFIVGGGEIYKQAFGHVRCRSVYLTRVDGRFACDAFIPDVSHGFQRGEPMATHHDAGFDYQIERWIRRRPGT